MLSSYRMKTLYVQSCIFCIKIAHLSALYVNINENWKDCMIGKNSPMSARREIILKVCRIKEYVFKLRTWFSKNKQYSADYYSCIKFAKIIYMN